MFAKFLDIETDGAFEFVADPQWAPIAKAVSALDGDEKTLVCLEGDRNTHMDIAGGAGDGCVVALTYDNEKYYTLINPTATGDNIPVKIGGESREYPAEMLVSKEIALKAAKTFAQTGAAEPSLQWRDTADVEPKES